MVVILPVHSNAANHFITNRDCKSIDLIFTGSQHRTDKFSGVFFRIGIWQSVSQIILDIFVIYHCRKIGRIFHPPLTNPAFHLFSSHLL